MRRFPSLLASAILLTSFITAMALPSQAVMVYKPDGSISSVNEEMESSSLHKYEKLM